MVFLRIRTPHDDARHRSGLGRWTAWLGGGRRRARWPRLPWTQHAKAKAQQRPSLLAAILVKAAKDFSTDQIPNVAASVTFYGLLAIFPALSALISLYSLFGDPNQPGQAVTHLSHLLPEGAVSVIVGDLQRLAAGPHGALGLSFGLSLLVALYSANAGMKALIAGLSVAYEQRETRSLLRLYLVSAAMTVTAVAVALASVAAGLAAPWARWPLFVLTVLVGLWALYRFGPGVSSPRHRTKPGGLLAAASWIVMSFAFSWYASHFGHFNQTFGSLGAVAGFMTWIWLSVMVVLFGAELNAAADALSPRPASGGRRPGG